MHMHNANSIYTMYIVHIQVLLVAGGCSATNSITGRCIYHTATTEIFVEGETDWVYTAPLPWGRRGLKGVSIRNNIIVSGSNLIYLILIT